MAPPGTSFNGLKKLFTCCYKDHTKQKEQARSMPEKVSDLQPRSKQCKEESRRSEVHVPSPKVGNDVIAEQPGPVAVASRRNAENETAQSHGPAAAISSSLETRGDISAAHKFVVVNNVNIMEAGDQVNPVPDPVTEQSHPASSNVIEEKAIEEVGAANAWIFDINPKLVEVFPSAAQKSHRIFFGSVNCATSEFEKTVNELKKAELSPEDPFEQTLNFMKNKGFEIAICRLEKSDCLAVLVNLNSAEPDLLQRYKSELNRDLNIQIPTEDTTADEAVVFGYLFAEFVAYLNYASKNAPEKKIKVVFHDWSEAVGLLFLNVWNVSTENIYKSIVGVYDAAPTSFNIDHRKQIEQLARDLATSSSV